MGRPRKHTVEAEPETPAEVTTVHISARALVQLLREDDKCKGQIDGLTGELREAIGNAVDKKHLNKKAYAIAKRFNRYKSDELLKADWEATQLYMDMAGITKRIEAVPSFALEAEYTEQGGEVVQFENVA